MPELWLVCEGDADSADVGLLKPVMTTVLPVEIVVEACHGGSPAGAAHFLQGQRGGRAGYVVDRDYEIRTKAAATYTDGTPGFIWRRHCIENYLLPPPVIVRAFLSLRAKFQTQFRGRTPGWLANLPTDPALVADILRQCARDRAAEEACRFSVHRLWEDTRESAGRVQKRVPSACVGGVTTDPAGWRAALLVECQRVRDAASRTHTEKHLEDDEVQNRYDGHYAEVTDANYLANLEFLVDFHGKDLLKQFNTRLNGLGINLSLIRLRSELVSAAVDEYSGNRNLYGTDDFRDLANGVRALAGLPPIA
jgi:hypothetical protein